MHRSMRSAAAAGLVVLALTAASCGGDDEPGANPGGTTSPTQVVIEVPPGEYAYSSYGVKADLIPEDDENTYALSITNKTGSGLAKPGIYALDANTGQRIDATVEGSAPLGNNQTKDFTVTFGQGFDAQQVGLVLLEFGSANWGAFTSGTSEG